MRTLYFPLWFLLSSSFFFFPHLISAVAHWMSTILSANLESRCETCFTRLAENTGCKKWPKIRRQGTIAQLCPAISSHLRHMSTIGKKLLNSNTCSTCLHNMANFGPLTAEIGSGVWDTPANFNGFRIFAALVHGTLVVGVSQTLRR